VALPMSDGSERGCVFSLSVRDERALHGCERALVADVEPKGFCFLGWADCFVVALESPRRGDTALFARKNLWTRDVRSPLPS
jgi:hypothetical protein